MAKKKSSAKPKVKKAAKKAVSPKKTKKVVKKAVKKAVKKTAKKVAAKKAAPKKVALKKAPQKALAKKAPVKKTAAKKSAPKKAAPKVSAVKKPAVPSHLLRAPAPVKKIDLTGFVSPLDNRVMVQVAGAERMTPGGLYIPDTVGDVSGNLQGVVVAVGRGHMDKKGRIHPMDVKVGDNVVFSQYAGSKIEIQNEDLIILRESEVMGVVSK
ncbi:10 kDa chaperonin 5 [compost metagenome]